MSELEKLKSAIKEAIHRSVCRHNISDIAEREMIEQVGNAFDSFWTATEPAQIEKINEQPN